MLFGKNNHIKSLLVVGVLSFGLSACGGGGGGGGDAEDGYFRFVNISSNAPDVQLEIDESVFTQEGFGESSNLDNLEPDTYELRFNLVLPNSVEEQFISDNDLIVRENEISTYVLYGDISNPEEMVITTSVEDIFDPDFDIDVGRVQFFHSAETLGDVDVYVVDAGDDLLNQSPDLFLLYEDVSEAIDFDIGDYKIIVTEAGTQNILIESDNIDINFGESYIYCIVSVPSEASDIPRYRLVELDEGSARVLANDAQPTYLRFNNAIADIDSVDIYFDSIDGGVETALIANTEFGDISAQIAVEIEDIDRGDSHELFILDSATQEVLDSFDIDIDPDRQILITAAGLSEGTSDERIRLNSISEDLRAINTHARIIYTHAIGQERDDSLEFLLVEDGSDPDAFNPQVTLSYLASREFEIEPGDYNIFVFNQDTGALLIEHELNGLNRGDIVNLTATEAEGGSTPYVLQEIEN